MGDQVDMTITEALRECSKTLDEQDVPATGRWAKMGEAAARQLCSEAGVPFEVDKRGRLKGANIEVYVV